MLNGISAVLITIGYVYIRRGRRRAHQQAMLAAVVTSALFLVSYLTKAWLFGTTLFGGTGIIRWIYFIILGTHLVLAITVVPLVAFTLYHTFKGQFGKHRRIARITFPVWLYVSVTGVAVYLLLLPWY